MLKRIITTSIICGSIAIASQEPDKVFTSANGKYMAQAVPESNPVQLAVKPKNKKFPLDFTQLPSVLQMLILEYVKPGWYRGETVLHKAGRIDDLYFWDNALLVAAVQNKITPVIFEGELGQNTMVELITELNKDIVKFKKSMMFSPNRRYLIGPKQVIMGTKYIAHVCDQNETTVDEDGTRTIHLNLNSRIKITNAVLKTETYINLPNLVQQDVEKKVGVDDFLVSAISSSMITIALSPCEQYLTVGRADKTVLIYKLATGALLHTIKFAQAPHMCALSLNGKYLAVTTKDGISICDLDTQVIQNIALAAEHITFVPHSKILLAARKLTITHLDLQEDITQLVE